MRLRSTSIAAAALAASLGLAACGGSDDKAAPAGSAGSDPAPAAEASGTAVKIKTFQYDPDPLTVKAGTKVTWTNEDDILHTVTSGPRDKPDGDFDGQLKAVGAEFSYTFEKAGTHEYVCSIHKGMDGKVIVE